jgi:hypothetical protein
MSQSWNDEGDSDLPYDGVSLYELPCDGRAECLHYYAQRSLTMSRMAHRSMDYDHFRYHQIDEKVREFRIKLIHRLAEFALVVVVLVKFVSFSF